FGYAGWVHTCAVGPDGSLVISGHDEGVVKFWDIDGAEIRSIIDRSGWSVVWCAVTATGHVIAKTDGETLKVWDATTGEELHVLRSAHGRLTRGAMSPDGSFVVSGREDGALEDWDAASGEGIRALGGHEDTDVACDVR